METKTETTNEGGKVLAYNGGQLIGQLDFAFQGEVMGIVPMPCYWHVNNKIELL